MVLLFVESRQHPDHMRIGAHSELRADRRACVGIRPEVSEIEAVRDPFPTPAAESEIDMKISSSGGIDDGERNKGRKQRENSSGDSGEKSVMLKLHVGAADVPTDRRNSCQLADHESQKIRVIQPGLNEIGLFLKKQPSEAKDSTDVGDASIHPERYESDAAGVQCRAVYAFIR